jgi:hypothetical protein
MRNLILFSLCLVLVAVGSGKTRESKSTQTTAHATHTDDADIQLLREDIRSERKKIVASNLPLTSAEATKFWPVYDQYIGEMTKINDARYALIKDYAQNYHAMTDAKAGDLIKRSLSLDLDSNQLRMKYIPEFEKVISPKKTAIFFQIDRRIDLLLNLQIASEVPLVVP